MLDSETFTMDMLSNPTKLASTMIAAMESSDTGTSLSIRDPNNGFVMQMLANMSIFSKFSEKVDHVTSYFYPQRARNADQLYAHLSKFDYVKLMAAPATLPFVFSMSRDWIIENGAYYDSNYNRIEIPNTSYFTMGGVTYSMYHPIEILINRNTKAISAIYDGSNINSLNNLASNMLLDVQEFVQDGIARFQITFNMYQFERNVQTFTVGSEQGFVKTLSYDDQFYAVKIFTKNKAGQWYELKYSLTDKFYDYKTPTAVLTLLNDSSSVKVEIPQIYFDNGQISQTVRVELYTTKGAINYSLSPADILSVTANFDTSSSKYAAPLAQMPTWNIVPALTEVQGGSNAMTYEMIRDALINQRLYDRVAVTTPQIIQAAKKAGFDDITRVTDDLTERMYLASNILTDSSGMIVPTFSGSILISGDSLAGDPSTILDFSDGYYTILPTTTFTIAKNGTTCTPMTDGQVAAMGAMTQAQMVAELNKGTYVRQPFHITLLTNAKSPKALIYNLMSPSMESLTFIKENAHSAPQMSVISCNVNHLQNGTGGYQILLAIQRSSNLEDVDVGNFSVYFTTETKTGEYAYIPAIYQDTNEYGVDIWMINLSTSYHITTDDYISVPMYDDTGRLSDVSISLKQKFNIISTFGIDFDVSVPIDTDLNSLLPPSDRATQVAMCQQQMVVSLGNNLSAEIYCGVNTSWGNAVYETATETIYYKTNVPIFQTDENGVIEVKVTDDTTNNFQVVKMYMPGDIPARTGDLDIKVTKDILSIKNATTSVYPVASTKGLLAGMSVRGTGVPVGSVITSIASGKVTLSKPIVDIVKKDTVLTFTNPDVLTRTSSTRTVVGSQLTIDDTSNLLVGQSVFGLDIPNGTTVKSIDSPTTFTLSNPSDKPIAKGTLLTIINTTAPGVIRTAVGDVVRDPNGNPVMIESPKNQFLIPAILFDGRLFASADVGDQEIISTISERLQNFANQITNIDDGLLETHSVFYRPSRTMGYADFGIGGGRVINMSLELSFSFTVYVDVEVYNTRTLLSTMEESIIRICNEDIQKDLISVSATTDRIHENLGSNIAAIEGGDISGRPGLRLISLRNSGAKPSIENLLSIETDGSISRKPNVSVTWLPKPDTSGNIVF